MIGLRHSNETKETLPMHSSCEMAQRSVSCRVAGSNRCVNIGVVILYMRLRRAFNPAFAFNFCPPDDVAAAPPLSLSRRPRPRHDPPDTFACPVGLWRRLSVWSVWVGDSLSARAGGMAGGAGLVPLSRG